ERAKLIDREEVLYAVAELFSDVTRVVGERLCSLLRLPATVLVLERLRQIPVIQRRKRLDAGRFQFVDQAAVEVDPLRIGLARPFRKNARPGDGKPVRVGADVLYQRNVFLIAVIMVVGDVAGVVVLDVPGLVRVRIPDRQALAILAPRTLNLV